MLSAAPVNGVVASLALVLLVNAAPIMARWVLGGRASWALDGGRCAPDGRPWLGHAKTWRGVIAAVALGTLAAPAMGYSAALGTAFALLAMLGDLSSSWLKRRLGIPPSGRARGLDQIPEALLPLAVLRSHFDLSWWAVALEVLGFVALALLLSKVLYRLRLRKRPY